MIIELIFNGIKAVVIFIISLLPSFNDFDFDSASLDTFFNVLKYVGIFLDLKVVSFCFVILVLISNIELIWHLIMWIVRKIPGVS